MIVLVQALLLYVAWRSSRDPSAFPAAAGADDPGMEEAGAAPGAPATSGGDAAGDDDRPAGSPP